MFYHSEEQIINLEKIGFSIFYVSFVVNHATKHISMELQNVIFLCHNQLFLHKTTFYERVCFVVIDSHFCTFHKYQTLHLLPELWEVPLQ